MRLFHGTSEERGKQILKERVIRGDAVKVYDENHMYPTTDGYIYLSNDISLATYYGSRVDDDETSDIFLFWIEVDESLLEPDYDEVEYKSKYFKQDDLFNDIDNPTLEESLKYAFSCRKKGDISFEDFKIKYIVIHSSRRTKNEKALGEYNEIKKLLSYRNDISEEAVEFKEKFISRNKWKEI